VRNSTRLLAAATGVVVTAALASAAVTYRSRQTEQLDYETVLALDGVELRRYPEAVAVETTAGDRREAFSRLFGYISDENAGERNIEMTAPVRMEAARIPMTAPVRVSPTAMLPGADGPSTDEDVRMAFYLPNEYTPETAPEPTDPDVSLVTEPARTLAVRGSPGGRPSAASATTSGDCWSAWTSTASSRPATRSSSATTPRAPSRSSARTRLRFPYRPTDGERREVPYRGRPGSVPQSPQSSEQPADERGGHESFDVPVRQGVELHCKKWRGTASRSASVRGARGAVTTPCSGSSRRTPGAPPR